MTFQATPDWDEVVTQSKAPITDPVYYAIVELGKEGPAVTYYLGQHPQQALCAHESKVI